MEDIRRDWNNIGWLRDAVTNASTKTFGRFADAKREQLTLMTTITAYSYAVKLLFEVVNMLTLLNANSVEPLMRVYEEFADIMKKQAEDKCKLSDADENDMRGEVVKEYDPRQVRETVLGFLKNQENQRQHAASLRADIVKAVGAANASFSTLAKKMNLSTLQEVTLKVCIEQSRAELNEYSKKNANMRLVNVNILDKLRNSDCSTPEKRKRFVKEIYNAAQSFLTFNGSEEGKGSPETAANHQKINRKGSYMMNTDMKKHVVHLLDTYHKRARQIAVLRYELSDPVKITEEEMIDTLQFAHREDAGHTEGHISNKTPYIALNYREKAGLLNDETLSEIAAELMDLEQEQARLEYYISLLEPRQERVLRRTCFEKAAQEAVAEELGVTVRRVQDIKAQAVSELAEMYGLTAGRK